MTTLIPPAYARATRRIAPHVGAQTSLDIAVTDGITNGMPRPLTGRVKPGSVAAVVAEYFDSQQFFASKGAGNSNLVGCSTGMSAGFAPRNILSMVRRLLAAPTTAGGYSFEDIFCGVH